MQSQSEIDRLALIFDWTRAGDTSWLEEHAPDPQPEVAERILAAAKQSNRLLEDQQITALARGDDNP